LGFVFPSAPPAPVTPPTAGYILAAVAAIGFELLTDLIAAIIVGIIACIASVVCIVIVLIVIVVILLGIAVYARFFRPGAPGWGGGGGPVLLPPPAGPKVEPKPDDVRKPKPQEGPKKDPDEEEKKKSCDEAFPNLQKCGLTYPYVSPGAACVACNPGKRVRKDNGTLMDGMTMDPRENTTYKPYSCARDLVSPPFATHWNCIDVNTGLALRGVICCDCCIDNNGKAQTTNKCKCG
jgi:hypothetical protein